MPEYPEETPDDEFPNMPQRKHQKFKPKLRLEPRPLFRWQALAVKSDVVTMTPLRRPSTLCLLVGRKVTKKTM